jgi:hypothetical protein
MNNSLVTVFEQNNTTLKEYNVRKLYLDAFQAQSTAGGQRYPQVNQAISNDIGNSFIFSISDTEESTDGHRKEF